MRRLVLVAAVAAAVLAVSATAHEDEKVSEMRAKVDEARAKLADAARQMGEATREQFAVKPDRAFMGVLIAHQGEDGVIVGGVTPDSGADAAGLQAGDLITGINGESLTGPEATGRRLREILDTVSPGDAITLAIRRDGELSEVDVTTAAHGVFQFDMPDFDWVSNKNWSQPIIALRSRFARSKSDLALVDVGEDLGDYFGVDAGVLVLDTPAKSDLKPGDIIKRVDGADVASSEEAYRLLQGDGEGEELSVEIRRKNRSVDVTLAPLVSKPSGSFLFRSHAGDVVDVEVETQEANAVRAP